MKKKVKPKKHTINIPELRKFVRSLKPDDLIDSKDIVERKLVINTKLEPSVFTLYRLIKRGQLKATNLGTKNAPRYFIKGSVLKKFLEERYKNLI